MTEPFSRADRSTIGRPTTQSGDGGSTPTSALQFWIKPVDHTTAREFIERWHYSGCIPKGRNIRYGLFVSGGGLEQLYAVIVYGIGVNPYQARFLGVASVLEIKRMCRSEPPMDYPLSRLIAITLRFVRKEWKPDCIVAFADPEHGHEGTVYKAAGFIRHGLTNPEWHVVGEDGKPRHRRLAFRHSRRHNCTIAESRQQLGLKRVKTQPKIRWIKRLSQPPQVVTPTNNP